MNAITPIANTTMAIRIAHGGHRMALGASFDLSRVVVATSELGRSVRAGVAWLPEVLAGNELTADTVESVSSGNVYGNGRSGTKLRMHSPPSRLAAYMARSAYRRSWSTVQLDAAVATVNPMLGRTAIGTPSITMAALNDSRTRCAAACDSSTEPSMSTANSSPPSRATVPLSPRAAVSRPATRTRSSSPAGWPKASLTDLKLSRSRHKTAIGAASDPRRATACSNRWRN